MSSQNTTPLPPRQIANLASILRAANARYHKVADEVRKTVSLTFNNNARHRASRLGLKVDIMKAVNCPQRQVAVLPLPILDISTSPVISSLQQCAKVSSIVIPAAGTVRRPPRVPVPTTVMISPLGLDIAPAFDENDEPRQSRWSMTPDDSTISLPAVPMSMGDHPDDVDDDITEDVIMDDEGMDCSPIPTPLFVQDSGSGSGSSSSSVITPNAPPLIIRINIKRKSPERQTPLKFTRKDWAERAARRSIRTVSARK